MSQNGLRRAFASFRLCFLIEPGGGDLVEYLHLFIEITLYFLTDRLHVLQQGVGVVGQGFFQVFAHAFGDGGRFAIRRDADLQVTLGHDRAKIEVAEIGSIRYVDQQVARAGELADAFVELAVVGRQDDEVFVPYIPEPEVAFDEDDVRMPGGQVAQLLLDGPGDERDVCRRRVLEDGRELLQAYVASTYDEGLEVLQFQKYRKKVIPVHVLLIEY